MVKKVTGKEVLSNGPFLHMHDGGTLYCSDWVSFDSNRYENLIKLPQAIQNYQNDLNRTEVDKQLIKKMVRLALLVMLEDKASTEEAITLTRYVIMKRCQTSKDGTMSEQNEKYIKFTRSRLELYIF